MRRQHTEVPRDPTGCLALALALTVAMGLVILAVMIASWGA